MSYQKFYYFVFLPVFNCVGISACHSFVCLSSEWPSKTVYYKHFNLYLAEN